MARTMAEEGTRTAVVERRYIGGSCVNIACLPNKNVFPSGIDLPVDRGVVSV